jgi:hypothetical protein
MKRRGRGEHGQVLILAVVALILVIIATLLLFDIQTVIRGKIKGQNGVDAAALTAAEWQKHSLNLIGELNLVRATGTLISDPFFARGVLEDPNSNAAEFFADLPETISPEEFTLFPEKAEFYNSDGSLNTEKLIEEVVRVEKEKRFLDALDDLVSQLQTRIAFAGPLIGFGAAQQAAKNNGLTYNSDASEFLVLYLNSIGNGGIYEHITPVFVKDYAWRMPYYSMLESIIDYSAAQNEFTGETENRAYGIAAGTKFSFIGSPNVFSSSSSPLAPYIGNKDFYLNILGRNWCWLSRSMGYSKRSENTDVYDFERGHYVPHKNSILEYHFSGAWWSDFEIDLSSDFSGQSEILPLHINFSESADTFNTARDTKALSRYLNNGNKLISDLFNNEIPYEYEVSDDVETTEEHNGNRHKYYTFTNINITIDAEHFEQAYNDEDADRRYDLLPRLSWATYDEEWGTYNSEQQEWEEYLRGRFKQGLDYQSGARAYFETEQDTVTVSGSMGQPRRGSRSPDVGRVFSSSDTKGEAQRVSFSLNRLNQSGIGTVRATATAKPIGRIRTEDGTFLRPFEAGRMVLPVFTETALIPIALEPVEGFSMLDLGWLYYLAEFVPLLSESSSLEDAWMRAAEQYPSHLHYFSDYYRALVMIGDPAFRQQGINWLNTPAMWARDSRGNRQMLYNKLETECLGLGKPPPSSGGNVVHGGGGGGGGVIPKQSKGGPVPAH